MTNRFLRNLLIAAVIVVLAIGATNLISRLISNNNGDMVPTSYGPTLGGVRYCGYKYDIIEAEYAGYPCTPFLYPANPPAIGVADYVVASAVWGFYLGNDNWINGSSYYDRVLLPSSRRTTTIIVSRNTYTSNGTTFNNQHRAEHNRYVKTYPPTFKRANDHSAKPKIFKGDNFASTANKKADTTRAQTAKRNNGGNAGTVTDPGKKTVTTRSNTGGSDSARDPSRAKTGPSNSRPKAAPPKTSTRRTTTTRRR